MRAGKGRGCTGISRPLSSRRRQGCEGAAPCLWRAGVQGRGSRPACPRAPHCILGRLRGAPCLKEAACAGTIEVPST